MRDSEHVDHSSRFKVDHVVRKAFHWVDSSFAQVRFGAPPNVFPGNRRRFTCKYSPSSLFDFCSPRSFNIGGVRVGIVQAGEKLRRHVDAFPGRQRQGFPQEGLRSVGHTFILDPGTQPNKRPRRAAWG